jgi:hypothetical protein
MAGPLTGFMVLPTLPELCIYLPYRETTDLFMREFEKIKRLPPYVFAAVNKLKMELRHAGQNIIGFGMENPNQPIPHRICE